MATQGRNDFGEVGYGGPKPPSGEHHYRFQAYALDTVLALARGVAPPGLEREMQTTSLTGRNWWAVTRTNELETGKSQLPEPLDLLIESGGN